jgi:GT2 family glycosyltransferase
MLELLQNISQLQHAADLLEEVIVLNNASTEDYTEVKQYIKDYNHIPFQYLDAPENLGVARGRNYALKLGRAPIIIMLDDDAVLQNKNCLTNLVEEFETNNTERPKAIVSFKVLYYDTLEMQVNALPHKRYEEYKSKPFFETYYYAGGAHAVKRDVIEKIGCYPEDFFYGMEEYDLAYRIINAGYAITYSDQIVMLHKESPLGRKPKEEKIRMMWVNKSKVAYRYLPVKYFYSTAFMWGLQYLKTTGFNLKGFTKGCREVLQIPAKENQTVISKESLTYLSKVKARLWY